MHIGPLDSDGVLEGTSMVRVARRSGYCGHRTLGLLPAGTICHSTRSLGHYPIRRVSLGELYLGV